MIQKDNDLDSGPTDYKQEEPSSNQTQSTIQDGDGERRSSLSADTKRLYPIEDRGEDKYHISKPFQAGGDRDLSITESGPLNNADELEVDHDGDDSSVLSDISKDRFDRDIAEMCVPAGIEDTSEEKTVQDIFEDNILAGEEQSGSMEIHDSDDRDSTDSPGSSTTLVPVDEDQYTITSNCNKNYCIKACSDCQEWEELTSVESFSYSSEDIRVGDIVTVIIHESNDETVAEIREIKKLNMEDSPDDDYFVLIF